MDLENGKTYLISHQRKGAFTLFVESQCDEWVNGQIVDGTASAMMDYNVKQKGEKITCRKSLIRRATQPLN